MLPAHGRAPDRIDVVPIALRDFLAWAEFKLLVTRGLTQRLDPVPAPPLPVPLIHTWPLTPFAAYRVHQSMEIRDPLARVSPT